ncbi:MAG: hypothetical protein HC896_18545 [Bacteroidales bacterium]|nr:hypothetical protein [Bacteroidales bacterium]
MFPKEASLYQRAFANASISIVYGSTEAEPVSSIQAKDLMQQSLKPHMGLPAGRPYYKASVKNNCLAPPGHTRVLAMAVANHVC